MLGGGPGVTGGPLGGVFGVTGAPLGVGGCLGLLGVPVGGEVGRGTQLLVLAAALSWLLSCQTPGGGSWCLHGGVHQHYPPTHTHALPWHPGVTPRGPVGPQQRLGLRSSSPDFGNRPSLPGTTIAAPPPRPLPRPPPARPGPRSIPPSGTQGTDPLFPGAFGDGGTRRQGDRPGSRWPALACFQPWRAELCHTVPTPRIALLAGSPACWGPAVGGGGGERGLPGDPVQCRAGCGLLCGSALPRRAEAAPSRHGRAAPRMWCCFGTETDGVVSPGPPQRSPTAASSSSSGVPVSPHAHVSRSLCPQVPESRCPQIPLSPRFPPTPASPCPHPDPCPPRGDAGRVGAQGGLTVWGKLRHGVYLCVCVAGPGGGGEILPASAGSPGLRHGPGSWQGALAGWIAPASPGADKGCGRTAWPRDGGMARGPLLLLLCCASALLTAETGHGIDANSTVSLSSSRTTVAPSPSMTSGSATPLSPPNMITAPSPSMKPSSATPSSPPNTTTAPSPSTKPSSATPSSPPNTTTAPSPSTKPSSATPSSPPNMTTAPSPSTKPSSATPSSPPNTTVAPSPSHPTVPSSLATGHPSSSTAVPAPTSPGPSGPPPAPSSPAPTVSPSPSSTLATSSRTPPVIGTSTAAGNSAQPPAKPDPGVVIVICLFVCVLVGGAAILLVWLCRRWTPGFHHLDEVPMSKVTEGSPISHHAPR
ncbi:putative LOC729966 homolog [Morphnus guianensis]